MLKQLLQLAGVLAITLFLSMAQAQEVSIINDPWNLEVTLSRIEVRKGIQLAELVYDEMLSKGGRLTVIMAPRGVLAEGVMGYYDFRMQTVYLNPEQWKQLDLTYKIYLIAHEVGHHFLRNSDTDDHCDMYSFAGYDHQVLDLMGVDKDDVWNYIDPFASMMACGMMGF